MPLGHRGKNARILLPGERLAIRCAFLVDGTGSDPASDSTILVEDGRFVDIRTGPAPRGFEFIDGSKYTLLPGLIDAHLHLTGEVTFDPYRRYLVPSNGVKLIRAAISAQELLSRGFTTVRDHGMGFGRDVKQAVSSGIVPGPRILTAVNPIGQTGGHGDWFELPYDYVAKYQPRAYLADGPSECQFMVRYASREGADFIKIFLASGGVTNSSKDLSYTPNYSREEVQATVDEAHRMGMLVAAHCMGRASVETALASGVDTIEHGMMEEPYPDLIRNIAESGKILVPTLAILHWVANEGEKYGVFQQGVTIARERLAVHKRTVALAHSLGVTLAAGSDNTGVMGDNNNALEFQLLVEAGLTPMEAIVSGTKNGARALGIDSEVGTVTPGKLADFILIDGDPLRDIAILQDSRAVVLVVRAP